MATGTRQRVRLSDIAAEASVSRAVVGHVLLGSGTNIRVSKATTTRVREVAQRLNYRPNQNARGLKGAPTNLIAALIRADRARVGYERLSAVEREADRRGYRLIIGQVRGQPNRVLRYIDDFESRNMDGMIYLDYPIPPEVHVVLEGQPVVFNTDPGIPGAYYVEVDRAAGVRMAVAHLISRGRRAPVLMLPGMRWRTSHERVCGFTEACQANGIKDAAKRISMFGECDADIIDHDALRQSVDKALNALHADSLVVSNDIWAVAIIKHLKTLGLAVPEDIAVTGFDNQPIAAAVEPELTTVDQRHTAFAKAAVDLLLQQIRGDQVPKAKRRVLIEPELVVRAST